MVLKPNDAEKLPESQKKKLDDLEVEIDNYIQENYHPRKKEITYNLSSHQLSEKMLIELDRRYSLDWKTKIYHAPDCLLTLRPKRRGLLGFLFK